MRFPLHLILTAATSALTFSLAYLPSLSCHHYRHRSSLSPPSTTQLYYQPGSNKDSDKGSGGEADSSNAWTVLANTERWISDTLDKSNKAANDRNAKVREEQQQRQNKSAETKMHFADEKHSSNEEGNRMNNLPPSDNPYARKEVSYVCETGDELSVVVGGIFRRVREARELGESHGRSADLRLGELM